jgi:hypothetical protein
MWLKAHLVGERSSIMDTSTRQLLLVLLVILGLVLMVGGIVAGKPGASIIGLILAAVNIQQWLRLRSTQAASQ